MVESRTFNPKVVSSSLGPAGIVGGGGGECTALSPPSIHDEVPSSKAPNPRLLPGCHSINDCSLLRVCVHVWCVCVCVCVVCVCVCVCVFTVCVCGCVCVGAHLDG